MVRGNLVYILNRQQRTFSGLDMRIYDHFHRIFILLLKTGVLLSVQHLSEVLISSKFISEDLDLMTTFSLSTLFPFQILTNFVPRRFNFKLGNGEAAFYV